MPENAPPGTGQITDDRPEHEESYECQTCNGTGYCLDKDSNEKYYCPDCDGDGMLIVDTFFNPIVRWDKDKR